MRDVWLIGIFVGSTYPLVEADGVGCLAVSTLVDF